MSVHGLAQSEAPSRRGVLLEEATQAPRTYGTSSTTVLSLGIADFHPIDSTVTWDTDPNTVIGQTLHRRGGSNWFKAPLHLPNGARIVEAEFLVCDTNGTNGVGAWIVIQPRMTNLNFVSMFPTAGPEAPGCVERAFMFGNPVVIDNDANSYDLEINLGAPDASIQIGSARIGYQLQVSPAPAVATFPNDVPTTHPYFRFIEALARSGVTAGCAPGSFCPENPISRGRWPSSCPPPSACTFPTSGRRRPRRLRRRRPRRPRALSARSRSGSRRRPS
jgi:hypothetical protein